jgi:hypothetical protein
MTGADYIRRSGFSREQLANKTEKTSMRSVPLWQKDIHFLR